MKKKIIVTAVIAISIIIILFLLKGIIPKHIYMVQVNKLAEKVPSDEQINYREDLHYTMDKLWSSHRQGTTTQNDLNEVMDRLNALNLKEDVSNDEIFDFIDYVSNIYTKAAIKRSNELFKSKD